MQSCFAITDVSKKLSLTEAIKLGIADNPQNLMFKKDVEIAGKEVKIADKLNNPSISYTQNMGSAGIVNPQQLSVSYEMELFKRMHRKRVAKANLLSAEYNFKTLENILIYDIKEAYFNLLYKKTNLGIYEQQKEIAKTILTNAEKEVKRGKIAKTDVVLAKIEYNRTLIDYNQAEFEVISAKNKFNSLMNTHSADYDVEQESFDNNYDVLLTIKPTEELVSFEDIKNDTKKTRIFWIISM